MKRHSDGFVPLHWTKQPTYKPKAQTVANKLAHVKELEHEKRAARSRIANNLEARAMQVARQISRRTVTAYNPRQDEAQKQKQEDVCITYCGWNVTLGPDLIKIERS